MYSIVRTVYLVRYNQVGIFDLFFARNRDFRPDEISKKVYLILSQLLFEIKWQTAKTKLQ